MANIDIEKLDTLVKKADEIFLTADGEQVLVELLKIQEQLDTAFALAKEKLEAAGLRANPNFSSIQGNLVKVGFRAYGAKYYIDEANINLAPKEFYDVESKVTYKIKTKELEKNIEETGKVPAGIIEVERKKTLTISLKKNDK